MASSSISCCSSWAKWGQVAVCRGSQGSAELAARVAKAWSQCLILATGIFLWEWQQRPYFLSTNSRTEVMAGLRSSCDQKAFFHGKPLLLSQWTCFAGRSSSRGQRVCWLPCGVAVWCAQCSTGRHSTCRAPGHLTESVTGIHSAGFLYLVGLRGSSILF